MGGHGGRAGRGLLAVAAIAGLGAAGPVAAAGAGPAAGRVPAASAWGRVTRVAGLGALSAGGSAVVYSVSCGSAGNCAAGGASGFVVSQRRGVWGQAIEVPGLGALSTAGPAAVFSVSCASAGNCAVGGHYVVRSGDAAFVASQRNGVWQPASRVPGLGALSTRGSSAVISVSCASAGNCVAGGDYRKASGAYQGFVVSQRNGVWRRALEVPGLAALNAGRDAQVVSVSCGSAGNCAAGGYYHDRFDHEQGFVVSQRNGVWGRAIRLPGPGPLSASGFAAVFSVSCASPGNCTAGGSYARHSGQQGFVISQRNGAWSRATGAPGLGALNTGRQAEVSSVSCASAGNCTAGGSYYMASHGVRAFVVNQRNGAWDQAIEVPGLDALDAGGSAWINSVSCGSAGNCAAAGSYNDPSGHLQGFVVSQRNGAWGQAIAVPGLGALNAGGFAEVNSVSCASAGNCAAGGIYRDAPGDYQGFVVSQRNGRWSRVIEVTFPAS